MTSPKATRSQRQASFDLTASSDMAGNYRPFMSQATPADHDFRRILGEGICPACKGDISRRLRTLARRRNLLSIVTASKASRAGVRQALGALAWCLAASGYLGCGFEPTPAGQQPTAGSTASSA